MCDKEEKIPSTTVGVQCIELLQVFIYYFFEMDLYMSGYGHSAEVERLSYETQQIQNRSGLLYPLQSVEVHMGHQGT